ncbi:MAG TPA: sulfatase-like hydrolase/transferase [Terriglobales bacterium]|nr:sulfatase-like hydrolase/transferase [Terriglobales bacterium]
MRISTWLLVCFLSANGLNSSLSAHAPRLRSQVAGRSQIRRPTSPPDLFLITIDTLRADHVQCYGYAGVQTPALNGLAKDGIRFANAFTASPITNSSHATILTGDLPSTHGVSDFGVPLSAIHPAWAELLQAARYHTAAFIGAAILDSKTLAPGFDRGFDFYDNFPPHGAGRSRWGRVERRGMDVVSHAEAWLSAHQSGPRFVWVHLYDPHDPYEPPAPYSQTYKDRPYDGEITYADSALQHFVNYLKQHGWYNNSLIVVVGDHGEGLGEHGEQTHGIFLYDSTLHVPLILKLPAGRSAGTVVSNQVRTPDILPTVLDLLSILPHTAFDGSSLKSVLLKTEVNERPAIAETDYPLHFGWSPLRALRAENFKLIEAPRPELYNLSTDPKELHNAYEPWNPTVQKFRELLAQAKPKTPTKAAPGSVPETTRAELRALGYLGPEGSTNVPEPSLLPDPKDKIEEQNLLHDAMLATDDDRLADARAALKQLLAREPKSATALLQLGLVELRAGNYPQAAAYFRQVRVLRPDDASAVLHLGAALEKSGDLAGAQEALESSLHGNPHQSQARVLLGRVYLRQRKVDSAQDQFEAATLLDSSGDTRLNIAHAWLEAGEPNQAIAQLQEASKLQPNNPAIYGLLAQAYKKLGKQAEANRAAHRAAALSGKATSSRQP